jgi:rhamnulose-1-phosphate aldolase
MKKYNIVVWAHHGMFCSGKDFDEAFGLMDTAEKAAEICVKVRSMGGKKQTITTQNFLDLAKDFKIDLNKTFLK